jgi:hypothetical protein
VKKRALLDGSYVVASDTDAILDGDALAEGAWAARVRWRRLDGGCGRLRT